MDRNRTLISAIGLTALLVVIGTCATMYGFHLEELEEDAELERLFREYTAIKIAQYEIENGSYDDYEVDVAFLGDSLTDGCDLSKYYPEFVTVNRGIGGDTTFGLEQRLGVSVYDLKPKVAVILIGGNNFGTMLDNYEDIIIGIEENLPHTRIVICSLTSMGMDWGRNNQIAAYNNVFLKEIAKEHGCSFVDLYTPLLDMDTGEVRDGYTTDGAHFTHEGYLVVSGEIKPIIAELLDGWTESP